jgi:4-hydroxy-4-methyl-2-oxoglutarate aldolase
MDEDVVDRLRALRAPVVYDAIERFGVRPRQVGYTDTGIRSILPSLGAFVGHAATGQYVAELPHQPGGRRVPWEEVWGHVEAQKKPTIMVCQDLDQPVGRGCCWGDVAAATYLRLGCVAGITNGTARDIREVEELGFGLFGLGPIVGHANIRFVEIGTPVKVGGLVVHPGELIHVDEHGAVVIPPEIDLRELLRVAEIFLASERKVIDFARNSPEFSIAELKRRMDLHDATDYGLGGAQREN